MLKVTLGSSVTIWTAGTRFDFPHRVLHRITTMASKSPKLPPEVPAPPLATDRPARRLHVHVVPVGDGWGIRVGRRIEKTFHTQEEASRAAIPFARERESRLFIHYPSGVVRESSTDPIDEMFLEMWQMAYDDYHSQPD